MAPRLFATLSARRKKIFGLMALAYCAALAGAACIKPLARFPVMGNIIADFGVGAFTLRDISFLGLEHWPRADAWLLIAANGLGIAGAGLLALLMLSWFGQMARPGKERSWAQAIRELWIPAMLAAIMGPYALMVLSRSPAFDRYLLPCLPLMMIAAVLGSRAPNGTAEPKKSAGSGWGAGWLVGLGFAAVLALFSALGTRDYVAWNRARWEALDQLTGEQGIDPARIDGGFEFNGTHFYDPEYEKDEPPGKSWWWVQDDEYIVAFGPIDGYREIARHEFRRWMLPGRGAILTLKRSQD